MSSPLTYAEFRVQYEQQHPASVPVQPSKLAREYPFILRFMVAAMFLSAALLSGVHTAPTIHAMIEDSVVPWIRAGISLFGLVAIEFAIFTAAYMRRKNTKLATGILVVTFTIAMASNLTSISRTQAAVDFGTRVVTVILGVGAPLIAVMSGELYVEMTQSSSKEDVEAEVNYREEKKRWDTTINGAYTKYRERFTLERASNSIPEVSNGNSIGKQVLETLPSASTLGHRKEPKASEKVRDYLKAHPDAVNMEPLELAALLGVGKSTVYAILPEFRNAQQRVEAVHALPVSVVSSNGKYSEVTE